MEAFHKLKKQVESFYPRPPPPTIVIVAAPDPVTSLTEVEPSERMSSDNSVSVLDAKNETVGIGDMEKQRGGHEDISVPESHYQVAKPSKGTSVHTVGRPAEETWEIRALSLHHDHQDVTSIRRWMYPSTDRIPYLLLDLLLGMSNSVFN